MGVTFKMDTEDYDDQVGHDTDENLIKSTVMLATSFNKVIRTLDKRYENNVSTNVKDNQHKNSKGINFQHPRKDEED